MKKLFISQPMNGLSDEEIKAVRSDLIRIAEERTGEKCEIIDSFFEGAPHDAKPLWFLGKSFQKLAEADVVIFGKGWKDKRGCIMENKAAKEYLPEAVIIELE